MEEPSKRDRAGERFLAIVESSLATGARDTEIWSRLRAELAYDELLLVFMTHGPEPLRATAARCYGKLLWFQERWTAEEIVAALRRRGVDLATMNPDDAADLETMFRVLEEADGST